ncbi:MAG: sirohydrochlorin chelatase, partial [Hyphomicrobiales bacterium]|nr:sirohydrochlorin chelatase [Hyphomicrobiales bacterium]
FLFTGILVQRIYDATDDVAKRHPGIEFIKAPYLNDHPAVIDTFVERVQQILTGDIAMNCQMCKYRTAVLGFEDDVGTVQESHHHHVEGINAKGPFEIVNHAHHHGHDHSHDDGHTHAPYPHASHPLGPVSMKKK